MKAPKQKRLYNLTGWHLIVVISMSKSHSHSCCDYKGLRTVLWRPLQIDCHQLFLDCLKPNANPAWASASLSISSSSFRVASRLWWWKECWRCISSSSSISSRLTDTSWTTRSPRDKQTERPKTRTAAMNEKTHTLEAANQCTVV